MKTVRFVTKRSVNFAVIIEKTKTSNASVVTIMNWSDIHTFCTCTL